MSISRSKSRQFNWKRKRKKGKKKLLSFQKKAASSARLLFFWTRRKKKTGRRGRGGKEVLFSGPLLQKRRKNNSEFHRRRTQQRALENRNFAHHSLVFSSLSRSVHSFIRFLPSVPVMGAKFMNVFFLYFFFLFFPLLAWVGSLLGKLLKFFASPPLLSFLLSLAFVVLFLR